MVVLLASLSLTACGTPAVDCGSIVTEPTGVTTTGDLPYYPREAVDYFTEIAFGAEFGSSPGEIHRWMEDVTIAVHGDPSAIDKATLCQVISEINALSQTVEVSIVGSGQNVDLYFVPESRFPSIEPNYRPGNVGFFWTWWDETGTLTKARILVSTSDDINQKQRNHIIREEVTQALGLMNDSYTHEDSIFYQPWSEVQKYSDLDKMVIEILYLPEIAPGMTVEEAREVIPYR